MGVSLGNAGVRDVQVPARVAALTRFARVALHVRPAGARSSGDVREEGADAPVLALIGAGGPPFAAGAAEVEGAIQSLLRRDPRPERIGVEPESVVLPRFARLAVL